MLLFSVSPSVIAFKGDFFYKFNKCMHILLCSHYVCFIFFKCMLVKRFVYIKLMKDFKDNRYVSKNCTLLITKLYTSRGYTVQKKEEGGEWETVGIRKKREFTLQKLKVRIYDICMFCPVLQTNKPPKH